MENFSVSKTDAGFHIEGFPDAVKVVAINGKKSKRLADLSLHRADLEFADACLDAINKAPEEPRVIREALWRSAIVHFLKCFGDGARFQLTPEKLYKGEPPEALLAFSYFKSLRNKHLVHDENSYAQSIPGAILNNGKKNYKIEKIVCFTAFSSTLEQGSFSNLKLLIQKARIWVVAEFDSLCEQLTTDLEKEPYELLLARDSLAYSKPTLDAIHSARETP
jgi:hypothetical protein